jgi:short-subunit dehydrogenase
VSTVATPGASTGFRGRYGPWALVAGASEGLGAALAKGAGARGCDVVLVARTESKLAAVAAEIERDFGVSTRTLAIDLSADDAVARVLDGVCDLEIGMMIYNAAAEPRGLLLETSDDELVRNVHMNCAVPTLLTKALAAKMVERGRGGIGLCSSGGALQGLRIFAAYGAAKAYELLLAEGLWDELREHGVDVMGYVIGVTLTPQYRRSMVVTPDVEEQLRAAGAQTPEECAERFFEVFGSGPRGYAHDDIEAKFVADASLPRADVVRTLGELMQASFG